MAIPGETSCRAVTACGTERWGDIPVEANTQYVDGSYSGGSSDGTTTHPWTQLQDAIYAADSGAIVAVAAGSYAGGVAIVSKSVRIWGRCPELVEVTFEHAYGIHMLGAGGSELHAIAVSGNGDAGAVINMDSEDILLDRVWIHDNAAAGVIVHAQNESASLTLRDSLLERGHEAGFVSIGAQVTVERSVIRDQASVPPVTGRGMELQPDEAGAPTVARVIASVIAGNREVGIAIFGTQLTIEGSVVSGTLPRETDDRIGVGIQAQPAMLPSTLLVERSCVVDNHTSGITVFDSGATLTLTTVDHTLLQPADDGFGDGVTIAATESGAADVTIDRCAISRAARAGVASFSAAVTIGGTALACNPIDLDGETISRPFSFEDSGQNACFCSDAADECRVQSSSLEPPGGL
jgi:hypothetical protein